MMMAASIEEQHPRPKAEPSADRVRRGALPFGDTTETHCPYCALQCGMTVVRPVRGPERSGGGTPPARPSPVADVSDPNNGRNGGLDVASRDFPTNQGGLCRKGWTSAELLDAPDRLRTPMIRRSRGEPLEPASWPEAIALVSRHLLA